ncbi:MAG: sulfatase/phosphatase domain-containing protein, partial [Bacteroidota bacterium]
IARWPGKIAAGSESNHISAFWDMYPTLAELASVEAPEGDGISFVPTLLSSGSQLEHDYLYWEFHERGGRLAARQGDWKAVRYEVLENPDSPLELYDLSQDIGEENNVASEHPEVVARMEEILQNARTPSPVFTFDQGTYLGAQ